MKALVLVSSPVESRGNYGTMKRLCNGGIAIEGIRSHFGRLVYIRTNSGEDDELMIFKKRWLLRSNVKVVFALDYPSTAAGRDKDRY